MARDSQTGVSDNLPEELPPVKPPSVGFIVQCGESTQVALMGIGLWLGRPGLCLGWIALQWVALAWVQLRREVALGQAQRA